MNKFQKTVKSIIILSVPTFFLLMLIIRPEIAKQSAINGMLICSKVIIPTLFPFMVGALFLSKTGILHKLPFPKCFIKYKTPIIVFCLSLLGGYPIGAKIISDEFRKENIDIKSAERLLFCCVNAGPSFIILTVGCGILKSKELGLILFVSHVLSSLLVFILLSKKIAFNSSAPNETSVIDAFVNSVADSSSAMINICAHIVFISTTLGLINTLDLPDFIKEALGLTLEISNAIGRTNNVYILTAILGFGGISIFFQIVSITHNFLKKPLKLLFSRIIHAALSTATTYILIKIFKIDVLTIGNLQVLGIHRGENSVTISLLLILTATALLYSLSSKKYCGKISKDIF